MISRQLWPLHTLETVVLWVLLLWLETVVTTTGTEYTPNQKYFALCLKKIKHTCIWYEIGLILGINQTRDSCGDAEGAIFAKLVCFRFVYSKTKEALLIHFVVIRCLRLWQNAHPRKKLPLCSKNEKCDPPICDPYWAKSATLMRPSLLCSLCTQYHLACVHSYHLACVHSYLSLRLG